VLGDAKVELWLCTMRTSERGDRRAELAH